MMKKFFKEHVDDNTWWIRCIFYFGVFVLFLCIIWSIFSINGTVPNTITPETQVKDFIVRRLVAIPKMGTLGGVLAGFAYYFGFPLWILRIAILLAVLFFDEGFDNLVIILYILCWIFMPTIDFIPTDFIARTGG